ncbi:hypothetical protein HDU98_007043 [Podochytrium sp. JEL0797]|nr:hypothetical protein HDU98_007043 [Podochytrium sp. JEL0797]
MSISASAARVYETVRSNPKHRNNVKAFMAVSGTLIGLYAIVKATQSIQQPLREEEDDDQYVDEEVQRVEEEQENESTVADEEEEQTPVLPRAKKTHKSHALKSRRGRNGTRRLVVYLRSRRDGAGGNLDAFVRTGCESPVVVQQLVGGEEGKGEIAVVGIPLVKDEMDVLKTIQEESSLPYRGDTDYAVVIKMTRTQWVVIQSLFIGCVFVVGICAVSASMGVVGDARGSDWLVEVGVLHPADFQ